MLLPYDVVEDVEPHEMHVTTCYLWQMLLPSGRWNSHYRVSFMYELVDVVTKWQME